MLKMRAISFPSLLAIFAAVIFWKNGGPYLFLAIAPVLMFAMTLELGNMLKASNLPVWPKVTAIAVGSAFLLLILVRMWPALPAPRVWSMLTLIGTLLFLLLSFAVWFAMLFVKDRLGLLTRIFGSAGLALLVFMPYLFLVLVYFQTSNYQHVGPIHLLFLVLVTKSMDTGGYIAGMLTGKYLPGGNHKIWPSISPKKSWEGLIGGIVLALAVAFALRAAGWAPAGYGPAWFILAAAVLALGSFFGDLTESAVKRATNVKDSAGYIPGMGGVFDVMDSFIYNGLLFTILLQIR